MPTLIERSQIEDLAEDIRERIDAGGRIEDLAERVKTDGRLADVVGRIERSLPDTDGSRYDRAFQRGFARARTGYLVLGLALGTAAGVVAAALLDPQLGRSRRIDLTQRVNAATRRTSERVAGRREWLAERAKGVAIERGIVKPPTDASTGGDDSVNGAASAPVAVGPGSSETWSDRQLAATDAAAGRTEPSTSGSGEPEPAATTIGAAAPGAEAGEASTSESAGESAELEPVAAGPVWRATDDETDGSGGRGTNAG